MSRRNSNGVAGADSASSVCGRGERGGAKKEKARRLAETICWIRVQT